MIAALGRPLSYYVLYLAGWWGLAAVYLILFFAAFLHWRQSRQWFLLVLAVAPLALALGTAAGWLAASPLQRATPEEIASGRVTPIQILATLAYSAFFVGYICAAVGGVGAIFSALKRPALKSADGTAGTLQGGK